VGHRIVQDLSLRQRRRTKENLPGVLLGRIGDLAEGCVAWDKQLVFSSLRWGGGQQGICRKERGEKGPLVVIYDRKRTRVYS